MKEKKQSNVILIAILGGIVVATVLIIGTIAIGRRASIDTEDAIHNVSLLYLDELTLRRQQVVSATINVYDNTLCTVDVTGKELKKLEFHEVRGAHGIKEAEYEIAGAVAFYESL